MEDLSNTWTSDPTVSVIAWCEKHIKPEKGPVLIGLSGGVDSVALLYALVQAREKLGIVLIAVTIDHGWRTDSAQDVIWCQQLCARLNVRHIAAHIAHAPSARPSRGSPEEDARYARRALFQQYAQEYGAQAIALGHHADDQIETFLIRLIRGAGITGLASMKDRDGQYIRPLLAYRKHELINWLTAQGHEWLTDSSNTDPRYLRNRIRHILIPALMKTDDRALTGIQTAQEHLAQARAYQEQELARMWPMLTYVHEGTVVLKRTACVELNPALMHEFMVTWLCSSGVRFTPRRTFTHELAKLLAPHTADTRIPFHGWHLILYHDEHHQPLARIAHTTHTDRSPLSL